MQNIKNFKKYTPTEEQIAEWKLPAIALYLISEDGQDWYQCQKKFSPDTFKVMYDENGVIRSSSKIAGYLTPDNFSVAEVEDTPENRRADHTAQFCYVNGKIVPRVYSAEELRRMNNSTIETMLAKATQEIGPLQDAIEIGRATDAQRALLIAWKNHRVDLIDLRDSDLGKSNITWPKPPVA
ncbi:TPA: tail fiber assembly protein [Citrobacter freundii]|nr:tail fiber assembly protein [Citrobacter freundii]HAT3963844.1 tail fiber assembly protein [Citrobacter freundii]